MHDGYERFSELFSDDFDYCRQNKVCKKVTEYFFTVHVAEQLYAACMGNDIIVSPEMTFREIFNSICLKRGWDWTSIFPDLWERTISPEESKYGRKRVDIAVLRKYPGNLGHLYRVFSLIEIKSLDQNFKSILNDVKRLSNFFLAKPHEKDFNSLECAFSVSARLLDKDKLKKQPVDNYICDETNKIKAQIGKLHYEQLNYSVQPFIVRSQGIEFIQEGDDEYEAYDGNVMELIGFLIKITKNTNNIPKTRA